MVLKKENIILAAQLLNTQRELADKLEEAIERNNSERLDKIKREMLKIQKRIKEIF